MENIPRSTQCVQQHLGPSAQFFTEEELVTEAAARPLPELEAMSAAERAQFDADMAAFEALRALAQLRALGLLLTGPCGRCGTQSEDLVGFQCEGVCRLCAVALVGVAP